MPWKEVSVMSQRLEFVQMASGEQANIRQLCRHFKISAPTGYKWLYRFQESAPQQNLLDQSRRPHHSPRRTAAEIEQVVIEMRTAHPAWGGRKIRARMIALGHPVVPQPSTITAILARHQLIDPSESAKRQSFCRFEHPRPNDLWQMDFKGDFALDNGRCFPLSQQFRNNRSPAQGVSVASLDGRFHRASYLSLVVALIALCSPTFLNGA